MNQILKSFSIILFYFFSIHVTAISDTVSIRLAPTQNSTQTIQNALAVSTKLPLKIILNGTFKVNRTLFTTKDHTIIEFTKGSKIIFTTNNNTGILLKNNYCTVKNGTIQGNGKSAPDFYSGCGLVIYAADHNKVLNMTFDQISGHSIFMMYREKGCESNLIFGNKIIHPVFSLGLTGDEAGIFMGYSGDNYFHKDNIIENNTVDGNNVLKIGIGLIGHGRDNIFRGNIVKNCLNYGIVAYESVYTDVSLSGTQILNNFIENIGEIGSRKTVKGMGIYLLKSGDSKISGNTVKNTMRNSDRSETLGSAAISNSISPNTLVENNIVDGSGMYGIESDYSFGSIFSNNKISNTQKSGAYFINMNDVKIEKNIFINCEGPVIKGYFQHTSLPHIQDQLETDEFKDISTGRRFVIKNNIFYTDKDVFYFTGTEADKSLKYLGNYIRDNVFVDNIVISPDKRNQNRVFFRSEIMGTNKINNTKISK